MKKISGRLGLLLSLIIISLTLTQCKKSKKTTTPVDPAFSGYVSAFTSGMISNQSNIVIKLTEAVPDVKANEPVKESLFSFSPSIKGETYWVDNQTIQFDPEEVLPSDKLYDVKFYLSKIIQVPDKLKVLKFQVQTIKQAINVTFDGLQAYEVTDLTRQKLQGKIQTADFADNDKLEQTFSATQNGKSLDISWEHIDGKTHRFTIENIERGKEKSEVIAQWIGKPINSTDHGDQTIEIAPLGDFKVFDMSITQQPEQCITIYFTDPLDPKQELEGLVRLKNGNEVKLVIKESQIKVYPVKKQAVTTSIMVEQGIKNIMGYQLKERYEHEITFTNIKPNVQLIGNGVILPNSNGLIFPFKAVNLNAVNVKIIKVFENNVAQFFQNNQFDGTRELKRVGRIVYKKAVPLKSDKSIDFGQWNNFSLDLSELIQTEPGAIYRVSISFDKSQSLYPCTEEKKNTLEKFNTNTEDKELSQYDSPDNDYYYYDDEYDYYDDTYNWNEKDDPCKDSYYMRNNHSIVHNVLASDLGIIAKSNAKNEVTVAVTDLRTTEPLSNVTIGIYNYQNQLMSQGNTNSDGLITISLDRKPFLLVAKKDKQRGYLRLDDGSALSLSMFDVNGEVTQKGVKGFIYGDRGVWRPGDSIFITFVLEDKQKALPENHPVVFELYSPENQLYLQKVKTTSLNGFYDFRTATNPEDPTGNWLAKVKVGGSTFSKYLKIETVKPNRLKINLDFKTEVLHKQDNLQGTLEVKWLHGAIARNLKADVNVTLNQGTTSFKNLAGYTFDDPAKKFASEEQTIFDGNLDENGKATITPKFSVIENAPGMLNARFKIRAFEKGGDFSTDQFTLKYSPYTSYMGIKVPEGQGWNNSLYSNEPNLFPIVTVDENGNPVDRKKVKVEIYSIYWRWWWEHSDDDDLASYISDRSTSLIKTGYVDTKDGKAMYEMNLNTDSWGRKLIRVTDPVSGHSCGALFYTLYKGWWNNSGANNPGGAEMLVFSTDKTTYQVGEEVKIDLPASEQGRALVSIESGSKIIETFWAEAKKDKNQVTFKTTEEMTPNVYIHISYIQPHNQTANNLPIRLYGVQNISVEDAQTHLNPIISMPDVLEPEKEVTIKVSEANNRKMTYTIAVVDDGLLDLTRFKTPNAWENFYAREALGIKTWDMYKYVIGAFSGEMAGLLALGGDEGLPGKAGQKANRFKPVVKFLGPFELTSGTATHTFTMPNYVGSVRTMVVAGYDGAYGSTEKTTSVKKPLMVIATLPRVLGPGEKVKLPVTIFAMDEKVKNVNITIEPNKLLTVTGPSKQSVSFDSPGDQTVNFDLEVPEVIGIGKIKITATSGKEQATYEIELDIRLPNPRVTQVIDGAIEAGKSWTTEYKAAGMKGTNHGTIEVSGIPPLNLESRLQYLIAYPHGCIEQTTSSVFPQLYLNKVLDLSKEQKEQIENNIKAGIERIKLFQLSNGGFSYWPGESGYASDWGTNYAGHFLLEAKALGYTLPSGMMSKWISFQTNQANNWSVSMYGNHYYSSSELTQAYRLYTLALVNKPAMGAMNRMREMSGLSTAAKWRLAAAYQLAGRENVVNDLINGLNTYVDPYTEFSYSYGSDLRDEAMILETLVLMNKQVLAKKVLDEVSEKMASNRWYSTQTTAYSLLAVGKFIGGTGEDENISYSLEINSGKKQNISTTAAVSQSDLAVDEALNGSITLKNNSKKMLFVRVQLDGIPLTGDQTNTSNDLVLRVRYLDMDGNPIDPSRLEQGTDLMAEVRVEHPGIREDYKEMALTEIFPSGWEIRNLRMEEASSVHVVDQPRYQDIRDDRVYSYFDLDRNGSRTFRIILNAAYAGKFYLPTVYCEAMYNNQISAQKAGQWVEVVEKGESAPSDNQP